MIRAERIRREYLGRVERVLDYVYAHCGEGLSLDALADVAAFFRFHFHRVFSSVVGETVSDFLKRVRLRQADARLTDHPAESVTEAAMAEWFSSSGYQPGDRPCYEVYLDMPAKHPEGKFVIDICQSVRPL